ncbi:MAG TPA: TRAP transporter small permease [Bacteroidota bacterium]|nr:TRAP transporter small permease [Bacteroidota bacterium]
MAALKILFYIDELIARVTGWILVFLLSVMILMAFGQVALRNFFHTSLAWGDVFLRHLVLWVGFLGAVIATGQGRHLKIEFIRKVIGEKLRKIFFIITNIFAAVICWYLMQASTSFVQFEREAQSILILDQPTWYFVVIIPIGYAVIAFRFLVSVIQAVVDIAHGQWAVKEHV